jgi:ubiquitin-conjugating enzyme E2 J2
MHAQFKKALEGNSPYIKFAMSKESCCTWYILIHGVEGDEGEYIGGEYLCKLVAPARFPFEPPEFYFMTPNGVYEPNKKVCISIGEFHKDNYASTMGMLGFATELVSGMIGWRFLHAQGGGIAIIETSVEHKKMLAVKSKEFNERFEESKLFS